MKKHFFLPLAALLLGSLGARAQSTVRVLRDSVTQNLSMRAADGKLRLINWGGGDHYTMDTATGAFSVFAQSPSTIGTNKQYDVQKDFLYSLNGRYPVMMKDYATQSKSRMVSIGTNGVVDTLFPFVTGVGIKQFPVDTLMWLTNDNKIYHSNLINRTVLADSGRVGSYMGDQARAGHGGLYYIIQKERTVNTGNDSFILYHHNGVTRKRLFATYISVSKPKNIGMLNGDFYFADVVGATVATPNRSVTIKKVSAAGVVTSLLAFPTGAGTMDEEAAIGAGKIWFPVNGYNGTTGRNFFVYDPHTNAVTQATAHTTTTVMPYINNGSISPDSFLYYRKLSGGFGAADTFFRTKGTAASVQNYGAARGVTGRFLDSVTQDYSGATQSFCGNYPVFYNYDTLRIGTDTGIAYSGLGTTFQTLFFDWTKLGNSYYCQHSLGGGVTRILKYTGCGIPQIQLGVEEPQLVFATAQTFPNPSHGAFQVRHEALNHEAKAQLFSLDGQLQNIQTATGIGILEVISGNLPTGIYILKIQQGKQQFTQRVEVL